MNTQTQISETEFVKSYIALWGEDEVEHLLEQGFEPVLVTDGNMVKWVWKQRRLTQREISAILSASQVFTPV